MEITDKMVEVAHKTYNDANPAVSLDYIPSLSRNAKAIRSARWEGYMRLALIAILPLIKEEIKKEQQNKRSSSNNIPERPEKDRDK